MRYLWPCAILSGALSLALGACGTDPVAPDEPLAVDARLVPRFSKDLCYLSFEATVRDSVVVTYLVQLRAFNNRQEAISIDQHEGQFRMALTWVIDYPLSTGTYWAKYWMDAGPAYARDSVSATC